LQEVQLAILDVICSVVKKKGIIAYSTCAIVEIENAEVVQKFLQRHPEFEKIIVPYPASVKAIADR
jgi:16S rRNA (cytosine967-C5)-methyltransferase